MHAAARSGKGLIQRLSFGQFARRWCDSLPPSLSPPGCFKQAPVLPDPSPVACFCVTFPSCFVHAGCIPQDMQLGGNRSTGRGSALTKYYKGGKMTAAEMAHVKNFFRLPKEATKEQVSFVAAAVTFQAARDKRAGASRQNKAATPAVAKKKMLLPSWFCAKSTPSPAQSEEDYLRGCSLCAGTVGMKFTKLRSTRTSTKQLAGKSALQQLLAIHRERNANSCTADEQLAAMVIDCEADRKTSKKFTSSQHVTAAAKAMEGLLVSGDIVWTQQVLARFLARPACVEIQKSYPVLFAKKKLSKEEEVYAMIVSQLRDFVTIITETKVPLFSSILPFLPFLRSFLTFIFPSHFCKCRAREQRMIKTRWIVS